MEKEILEKNKQYLKMDSRTVRKHLRDLENE